MERKILLEPVTPDFEFCAGIWVRDRINADNPKLFLEFDSHLARPGRGFKANYYFTTGYYHIIINL